MWKSLQEAPRVILDICLRESVLLMMQGWNSSNEIFSYEYSGGGGGGGGEKGGRGLVSQDAHFSDVAQHAAWRPS